MFSFSELEQLHIEITSNCQASCPMCARNYHGGKVNPNLKITDWSLLDFKKIFTEEVLVQVKKIIFCGNFGDPILNNNLLDMCCYIKDSQFTGNIVIHTNGSARNISWWKNLYKSLPTNHTVVFGLDGLSDTHHLYRIGTNFEKIIENARAFISVGGNAEWAFIKFKHNEHQVNDAEKLALELGFKKFSVKASMRFNDNVFPVLDKSGEIIYNIEPATSNTIKFFDKEKIKNFKQIVSQSSISCQSKQRKELYIDHLKTVFPCCYTASAPYLYNLPTEDIYSLKVQAKNEVDNIVQDLGTWDQINLENISIKDLLDSPKWSKVWDYHWVNTKPLVCVKNCGDFPENNSVTSNQFIKKVEL